MKKRKKPGPKPIVPEITYQSPEELTPEQQRGLDAAFDILFDEMARRGMTPRRHERNSTKRSKT